MTTKNYTHKYTYKHIVVIQIPPFPCSHQTHMAICIDDISRNVPNTIFHIRSEWNGNTIEAFIKFKLHKFMELECPTDGRIKHANENHNDTTIDCH